MVVVSNLFSLMMRARLRTKGGTASRACASFSATMMAHPFVDASFASPVKIPEIALRVDQLDQNKEFRACVGRLDQVTIHGFPPFTKDLSWPLWSQLR